MMGESFEQKTEGIEKASRVGCQWKEHLRQREWLVPKPWERGMLDLFNSKEVKVMKGQGGRDVIRSREVVWIMENSGKF